MLINFGWNCIQRKSLMCCQCSTIDSFIDLDQDLSKSSKILVKLRPVFEFQKNLNGWRNMEALFLSWKFRIFVANWSWIQVKILFGLEMRAFWLKLTEKQVFSKPETGSGISWIKLTSEQCHATRVLWLQSYQHLIYPVYQPAHEWQDIKGS